MEYMVCSQWEPGGEVVIQEDPVKATSKFKYLGCQFQSDGGVESDRQQDPSRVM